MDVTRLQALRGRLGSALGGLRRLRVAPLYLTAILLVNLVLEDFVDEKTRYGFILANSTNVANLQHYRIWTLVTSAFICEGPLPVAMVVGLAILLVAAELLWGRWLLAGVFVLANATASILVYLLLEAGASGVLFAAAKDTASDVGVSYGFLGVAAALAVGMAAGTRRLLLLLLALIVAVPLFGDPTFNDFGHALAVVVGAIVGWVVYHLRGLATNQTVVPVASRS